MLSRRFFEPTPLRVLPLISISRPICLDIEMSGSTRNGVGSKNLRESIYSSRRNSRAQEFSTIHNAPSESPASRNCKHANAAKMNSRSAPTRRDDLLAEPRESDRSQIQGDLPRLQTCFAKICS